MIAIGDYTISADPRSEPTRTVSGSARRAVQVSAPIRGDTRAYDRANRTYEETLETAYSYADAAEAEAGWRARRAQALRQPKALYTYEGQEIGPAIIESCDLVWRDGCGITLSYRIIGEFA